MVPVGGDPNFECSTRSLQLRISESPNSTQRAVRCHPDGQDGKGRPTVQSHPDRRFNKTVALKSSIRSRPICAGQVLHRLDRHSRATAIRCRRTALAEPADYVEPPEQCRLSDAEYPVQSAHFRIHILDRRRLPEPT